MSRKTGTWFKVDFLLHEWTSKLSDELGVLDTTLFDIEDEILSNKNVWSLPCRVAWTVRTWLSQSKHNNQLKIIFQNLILKFDGLFTWLNNWDFSQLRTERWNHRSKQRTVKTIFASLPFQKLKFRTREEFYCKLEVLFLFFCCTISSEITQKCLKCMLHINLRLEWRKTLFDFILNGKIAQSLHSMKIYSFERLKSPE